MTTFSTNKTYSMRFICDSNLVDCWIVTKRTAKTLTLKNTKTQEIKKCRVSVICDEEVVYPLGKYSMCPILRASNIQ